MTDIFYNNKFIGTFDNPKDLIKKIRELRRKKVLPNVLNFEYVEEQDNFYIYTESGRVRRPLIVVENGKSKLTPDLIKKLREGEISWWDLVDMGIIEYLDAGEEENCLIALYEEDLTKEHTHLEISPLVIFGVQASLVPYGNHGPSSRLLRGVKMVSQSMGLYSTNFHLRMNTDTFLLHYPQKPIVKTITYDALHFEEHPDGQNIILAILSGEGYNMEDAIVMNKSSIDRGLFRATFFRPYEAAQLRYPGGQSDSIEIPDKDVSGYRTEEKYKFLEEDGIIAVESHVESGDVLIGKVSPPRFLSSLEELRLGINEKKDTSIVVRHGESGIVDMVILSENEEGDPLVRVNLRTPKIPEIGDKFTSRHGQKGVIGMVLSQEDMPFSSSGIVPDIVFNPHGIPSRMTVGHLLELLAGKVGALSGKYIDGTSFTAEDEKLLRKELFKLGFREDGMETFYNGKTGEIFKARVFVGNMFYMRLRHIVSNKIQARSTGPVQLLTRQPTEGKAKQGGLRLGEMEKDCFVAHGAALALKERFDSDKTIIPVCKNCGMVCYYNYMRGKYVCPVCGENAPIVPVEMSYAFKLLTDELKSLCIFPKIVVEEKM